MARANSNARSPQQSFELNKLPATKLSIVIASRNNAEVFLKFHSFS
jgi:hypothetical protein